MRGFIVLCFAAVALAAPQGYNYNPAGGQQSLGMSGSSFSSFGSSGTGLTAVTGPAGLFQGVQQQGFFGQTATGHQQQQHQQQMQQEAVVSKRFYIHSAPEENDEENRERFITVGVPKKSYNVVFIKSPRGSAKKAAIKISPAVNEEKTVIYVLNKKADSSDIQAEVIETAAPTSKPEVFFIKYKTNEEAAHAQEQIQAQYDALGGSSQVSDEGVAPVTSVIGSLGNADAATGAQGAVQGAAQGGSDVGPISFSNNISGSVSSGATSNAYLPPTY